jgi:parallel beta-helix repeat protein
VRHDCECKEFFQGKAMKYGPLMCAVGCSALVTAAMISVAGPLDPPPGPVAPSFKTLQDVEPRTIISDATTPGDADSSWKITKSGSYYLDRNLNGVDYKHGIEIEAPDVTIDLNGFALTGAAKSMNGIVALATGVDRVTIRNGSVVSWGQSGILLIGGDGTDCLIENMRAVKNGSEGMIVDSRTIIRSSSASQNAGGGFTVPNIANFENCIAESNRIGFSANPGSSFSGCFAGQNERHGFLIASGDAGTTFENCTASANTLNGFLVDGTSNTLTFCTASGNKGDGFKLGLATTISNSAAHGNNQDGISLNAGSSVVACTARNNSGNGIDVGSASNVRGCVVQDSGLDGIRAFARCIVADNTSFGNGDSGTGGAGIVITGNDCRVEANNCVSNPRGIDVHLAGNIIIRNTCSGNVINWSFVAGNVFGPIIDRTSPGTSAVSGNSAVDSTGSTHPNANFTY